MVKILKSEISTAGVDTILIATSASCTAAIIDGGSAIPFPVLIAGATVPAFHFIRRNFFSGKWQWSWKKIQFNSMSNWTIGNDPDISTAIMRWKEEVAILDHEFYFRGLGLPCQISESKFRRFIEIARRRQTDALYGDRDTLSYYYWGNNNNRRVKANEVLSNNYYLSLKNPRWTYEDIRACKEILGYTRLLKRKGQGDAGHLVGDYGVGWYVQEAKRIWILLTRPPIKNSIFDLKFNSLTNILKSHKVVKSNRK